MKNVEKSRSVSSRVCFIMLNSDGWISSEGSNELSLIFEALHIICYIFGDGSAEGTARIGTFI